MNVYQYGRYNAAKRGIIPTLTKTASIYSGFGTLEAATYASGALLPVVGPVVAGVAATALGIYGAKQIYEGIFG